MQDKPNKIETNEANIRIAHVKSNYLLVMLVL